MEKVIRKATVNGKVIELWSNGGLYCVTINGKRFTGSFEDAMYEASLSKKN